MKNILEELQPIFRDVFDDTSIIVTNETNAEMIEDWDSLSHIRLVVAIEKHFGIKLDFDELKNLNNVGDMVAIIETKIQDEK